METLRLRDTRKTPADPGRPQEEPGAPVDDTHEGIRCPKCRWRPRKSDLWTCTCWHSWNTFDTRGRCPGCGYVWPITQCLRCQEFSPHEEWYGD